MKKNIENSAIALISQYGEEAETIAMLRAAEYAASLDTENWLHWEQIIKTINNINLNPSLDG
ncbi:MAG: hypothetical protein P8I49_05660 [SAR86 cluster bacterium]|nr:hypothetical protein [SAR86 cluster bacterium]